MSATETMLPARLPELVLRSLDNEGRYVAKNPKNGVYLEIGEPEFFLLSQLDGQKSGRTVRRAYQEKFTDVLTREDLNEFIGLVRHQGLLVDEKAAAPQKRKNQSILFCRYSLFDPDRMLNWLAPRLSFVWTRAFLVLSTLTIVAAALMVWTNRFELVTAFDRNVGWQMFALAWVVIILSTFCHEFAHGLTLKRYGGECHEIGALLLFFTPCFYCDVSDAWLIREKSKRLWVTFAGAYCDLCIWAATAFVWRITMQDTLVNYLAWVVLSVVGGRILFNFNPFMKLDGYYLLSDLLEVPNLRSRAKAHWMGYIRWALWGAQRPAPQPRGRLLLTFGMYTWVFSVAFFDVMFVGLCHWLGARWGLVGVAAGAYLGIIVMKRMFSGFFAGEFKQMVTKRHFRTAAWVGGIALVVAGLFLTRVEDRTGGSFQVRPGVKAELRAAVAGFLREVSYDEGDRVGAGMLIARLEMPDLASLTVQKQAEIRESQANLRRLEAGSRPEEVAEARSRVERAVAWVEVAKTDLARGRHTMNQELAHLDEQIQQLSMELEYARTTLAQSEKLYTKGVLAGQQLMSERKKFQVVESQCQQAQFQKRAREALGVQTFEAELGRREKELADTRSLLLLLQAGSRPEEIEAERARQARLKEELAYLDGQRDKLLVQSPVAGTITTGRLKEKIGQYFEKGALICVVEDVSGLEAEISLPEQEVEGVVTGQIVQLKARALPFKSFDAKVDRIAPAAVNANGEIQSKLVVYCRINNPEGLLRSGMTGFGRIYRGNESIAAIAANRSMRYLRTEFWW